jgi:hypothetical protein
MWNNRQTQFGAGEMKKSEGASAEMREEDHSTFRIPHAELTPFESSHPTSDADEPDAVFLQRWLDLNA